MKAPKPYASIPDDKKSQVMRMFNSIAWRYDFLNHFLSLGIDRLWRKRTIRAIAAKGKNGRILDVATGTGDLAIAALRLQPREVIGIDIAEKMLAYGKHKVRRKAGGHSISLKKGDAEALAFADNTFDAITCAFGVRNFGNLQKGLEEMHRVLRPGGQVVVLEFSKPAIFPVKQLFNFYFYGILPFIGRIISRDHSAYAYLPSSVGAFPDGKQFVNRLKEAGFTHGSFKPLTLGIATLYMTFKPDAPK